MTAIETFDETIAPKDSRVSRKTIQPTSYLKQVNVELKGASSLQEGMPFSVGQKRAPECRASYQFTRRKYSSQAA